MEVLETWTNFQGDIFKKPVQIDKVIICFSRKENQKMVSFFSESVKRDFLNGPIAIPEGMKRKTIYELAQKISDMRDWSVHFTTVEELENELQKALNLFKSYGFEPPTADQILSGARLNAKMMQALTQAAMASEAYSRSPF